MISTGSLRRAVLVAALAVVAGCSLAERVGVGVLYKPTALPADQISHNLVYGPAAGDSQKLDLFLPSAPKGWPVIIFVHGGGWNSGDKGLRVGGKDVYGAIGRFYAAHGYGTAVINYRLQPDVTWQDQVRDVADAVAWVRANIAPFGGDPDCLFLMGHSAGTYLAAYVALRSKTLSDRAIPPSALRGVIAVSGAGLDLSDEETYKLGADPAYYEQRFAGRGDWKRDASPLSYVTSNAPPFLILRAGNELPPLKRQSTLLDEALKKAGVESRLVIVPGQSHTRIVLTLSRDDRTAGPAILDFLAGKRCSASPPAPANTPAP
jgi:acetyl esterase/lipase